MLETVQQRRPRRTTREAESGISKLCQRDAAGDSKGLPVSSELLCLFLITFRVLNAYFIRTSFVPDEFWQSTEVAHRWAFGYGGLAWEWWPTNALRSPLHPLVIAAMFRFLGRLGLDSRWLIIFLPRLIHGALAGLADFFLYRLVLRVAGSRTAKWTLIAQCTNWFTAFCGPRSLANSIEWALTVIAFNLYPWHFLTSPAQNGNHPRRELDSRVWRFILVACICSLIRPTAALIWAPVCLHHLFLEWRQSQLRFMRLFLLYAGVTLPCLGASILTDRIAFDRWTMNQINFLRFNLFSNGANFYGVESWHWYLTSGIPTLLTSMLPITLIGMLADTNAASRGSCFLSRFRIRLSSEEDEDLQTVARFFVAIIAWNLIVYSLIAHKEFRFIFPILPLLIYFCGRGLVYLEASLPRSIPYSCISTQALLTLFLITTQLPLTLYTCFIHQRGPTDLLDLLAIQAPKSVNLEMSALFLMPCHTTPSTGFMHRNISLRLLACDPDLSAWTGEGNAHHFVDEADDFYADPSGWLSATYPPNSTLPQYVAVFDKLLKDPTTKGVAIFLRNGVYSLCRRIFHTHFPVHSRHGQYIEVFCQTGWQLD